VHDVGQVMERLRAESRELSGDRNLYHDNAFERFGEGLAEDGRGGAGRRLVLAKVDDDDLVLTLVHLFFEFGLQADSVDRFQDAEED